MKKKYESLKKPKALEHRFENNFPLLYPMDTVIVSDSWAGDGKNPLEGRLGYVHRISHGLQSGHNRDYLIATMMGDEKLGNSKDFEMWLYTLDLVEKDGTSGIANSVSEQFDCLLYIDDRIRIVNDLNNNGKTGPITSLQGTASEGGWLLLEIDDEAIVEEIRKLYHELDDKVKQEYQGRSLQKDFNNYVSTLKDKDPDLYELNKENDKLREIFEMIVIEKLNEKIKKNMRFDERLGDLNKRLKITGVSSKDVELIERFPPNDLFNLN